MVQGTVKQEVPTTKKKEVLGQCSLGTVPKSSWDSAVLGQYQRGLGTVQSWDSTKEVLGHWSWDTSFGIVVLGQWSWDKAKEVLG